jgi:Protein of unknown function (DUF2490)
MTNKHPKLNPSLRKKAFKTYFTKSSVVLLVLFMPFAASAQKTILHQTQLWYAYFNNLKFNDKWRLLTDVQERQFIEPVGAQGTFLFRSILYHNLGSGWEMGAGLARFYQSPTKIPTTSTLVVPEWRPTIDFVNKSKAGAVNFSQRFRFEARYFHNLDNTKTDLADGYTFGNFRCRYQFGADYPIIKNAQKKLVLSIRAYDEVMVNFGSKIVANTFDQNRIYGGLMYTMNKNFAFELGYLNWFQETSDGKTYYNRNIIRFGINHTINLAKSKSTTK